MAAIVRVLWGCDVAGGRWSKVWNKDVLPRLKIDWDCEQHVYVYGAANVSGIEGKRNCIVTLVDPSPFPDGRIDVRRGRVDVRPWHYKWQLIRRALEEHGEVIYCDWDVDVFVKHEQEAVAKMPRDLDLSAFFYRRPRYTNRPDRWSQRFAVSGAWMHFRDMDYVDRVLGRMRVDDPRLWHDEFTMGVLLDEDHGNTVDQKIWLERYESPVMVQRHGRTPWKLISDDGRTVVRETPVGPFVWERMFGQ